MAGNPIPVVIVTGFLGSGKTTLLNHLLHNKHGARIGAIVNDFGSVNIDAMLIAGQVDAMVSLANGCLCCAVDSAGMDDMLAKLARPGEIDLIVVEASGVAEPRDLVRLMVASELPEITYGGLIEVVDAAEFDVTSVLHPELVQHLKAADLVVVNKTDRAPDPDAMLETVRTLSCGAPVIGTEFGRIDSAMLFDGSLTAPDDSARQLSFADLVADEHDHEHGTHHEHLHARYQSVEFATDEPLHPRRFLDFLNDRPAGLYRLKGFAYFGVPGHEQKFEVQTVGSFVRFTRAGWERGEEHGTQLVLIGAGLDTAGLLDRLRACEYVDTCAIDEQSMFAILRYLEP